MRRKWRMSEINIPESATKRLMDVVRLRNVDYQELLKETLEEANSSYIQADTSLPTIEDKIEYCSKIIKSRYLSRPPQKTFNVIVMGMSPIRSSRSGSLFGDIFCIYNNGKENLFKRISVRGRNVEIMKRIQTGYGYKVKLGQFRNGGDFIADDRSRFENPVEIGYSLHELLKMVGIKRITIREAPENTAKLEKTSTGTYPVRSDWRIIRGIVGHYSKGQRKDGSEWGVYTITDDSLDEEYVTPDGSKMVRPAFTVWVNPLWVVFEKGSEIDFCGPILVNQTTKECYMDGYLLIPIHGYEVRE